jgi:hypothetical protein
MSLASIWWMLIECVNGRDPAQEVLADVEVLKRSGEKRIGTPGAYSSWLKNLLQRNRELGELGECSVQES